MRQERASPIRGRPRVGALLVVWEWFITEEGRENEMTSTSPDQTKTLVLKAFDLLCNKHDYDARRTLPVEKPITSRRDPPYETLRQ
jgi:hypothetical protein